MFEAKCYIVWWSSKGSKEISAIFANKKDAEYNAKLWEEEARELGHKCNYRVKETTIYGESYPIICRVQ